MSALDTDIVAYPIQFILALLFTILCAIPISALLERVARQEDLQVKKPKGFPDEVWKTLMQTPGKEGGRWIGHFERLLFFVALTAGEVSLILAWAAFKVASKWDAWKNVYLVPDHLPRVDDAEWFLARTRWGSKTYQRVLIGTAANITAALLGLALFKALIYFVPCR